MNQFNGHNWQLHVADCLEVMRGMETGSIDAIVTDPPYGLTFMGKDWDKGVPGEAFWAEAIRIAKPGTHLLAFGGTRTFHRLTCAIEDAGWEIRDCLMWLYGSGFPKSHNLAGEWEGWGSALKPGWEPIIMARKPFSGTLAANVAANGTGALNIDGCRITCNASEIVVDDGRRVDLRRGVCADGYDRPNSTMFRTGKPAMRSGPSSEGGRWPANVILDPEAAEELGRQSGESKSSGGRAGNNGAYCGGFKQDHYGDAKPGLGDTGTAARFFYVAKPDRAERDEGLDGFTEKRMKALEGGKIASAKTPDAMGGERTGRNNHPTVKPLDLMRYLCRLITPPGGMVLDPFTGSGTTGRAAIVEGFQFVGAELSPEYAEIAARRIASAPLPLDFDAPTPQNPVPKDTWQKEIEF